MSKRSKSKPKNSRAKKSPSPRPQAADAAEEVPAELEALMLTQPDGQQKRLHPPAMVNEVLAYLRCRSSDVEPDNESKKDKDAKPFEGGLFIDGTLGTAGHTIEFLKAHSRNRVLAFD